jgi:DNA-binding CsgD family transcriptional regulator
MLVGRSGLSPVMVGRAPELGRLARLLGTGQPAIALVGGEAGVGKTRLLQEVVARVPAGTCVLVGQADSGALGRPFELLLDAVDGKADDHADLVAEITDPAKPAEERVRAGLALVRRITNDAPALIVFDDLHWADSESVALFERLAEPDGGNLLLVGTYRPDRLSRRHPVAELLPRLERRHSVTHIRLDRLTPSDVSAFLAAVYGRPPSFRVVEALHARTGGNPFFLEELLAAAGDADLDALCSQPLPWSLAEVVRAQLDDLDPEQRRIVEAASVLGRKVPFDLLATVTRTTEDELIDVLRDLVNQGLMLESDEDVFSFRHALAREAIEGEMLGRERRRLHEAALVALREAGDADMAAIARHAQGAGRYGDMVDAARQGAVHYLSLGSSYQALNLAELGLEEADDDIDLLCVAARAAWLAGLVDDSQAHAEQWLAVARRHEDLEAESAALRLIVRLRWDAGDSDGHLAAAQRVKEVIPRLGECEEQGRAMAAVAQAYMLEGDQDEAVAWSDRAIGVADALDLPDVRVAALVEKGSALMGRASTVREGLALLEEVADEAERLGEDVIAARALHNQIRSDVSRPNLPRARQILERMRMSAERAGFDSMAGASYAQGMADLAEWEGDLPRAIAYLEDGRSRDRGAIAGNRGGSFHAHEGGLALEIGDLDRADAVIREVGHTHSKALWLRGLVFHVACRRGDLPAARVALRALLDAVPPDGADVRLVHDVSCAAFAAGLTAAEMAPLFAHLRLYETEPLEPDNSWHRLLRAQALEAEHRIEEAAPLYLEAAGMGLEDMPAAARGTALVSAARCLALLGRTHEAREAAAEAEVLLARWSGWRRDELDAVLRRLGGGDTPSGPESLTPREREVVALLADGLSNAELAERLYISRKTAAVHVSNILAKLGMTSRAEIAAFAVREGMAQSMRR